MSQPALHVENLSKLYHLGAAQERHDTLRDTLVNAASGLFHKSGRTENSNLWALRDVSFEVQPGEVLGIIGRNGAGKSTLLKILSRITEPTSGRVVINGRVGSLLEVGTGFHPELTGRENIYLNGAILGMRRAEISRRFDEIVAFAEIEKFLDTPVKRYSSGMYVRLAFAVASHLDPEIFLVDEVLAVGDVNFQKKCLGKMDNVSKQGRTVILVSHQMNMIRNLSTKCIFLEQGSIIRYGHPDEVILQYTRKNITQSTEWLRDISLDDVAKGYPFFSIKRLVLVNESGTVLPHEINSDEEVFVQIEGTVNKLDKRLCLGFILYDDQDNAIMLSFQTDSHEDNWPQIYMGNNILRARLEIGMLNVGEYRVCFILGLHSIQWIYDINQQEVNISFEVLSNTSQSPYWTTKRNTMIAPVLSWKNIYNYE